MLYEVITISTTIKQITVPIKNLLQHDMRILLKLSSLVNNLSIKEITITKIKIIITSRQLYLRHCIKSLKVKSWRLKTSISMSK